MSQQSIEALAWANEVRIACADYKRAVKLGVIPVDRAIVDCPYAIVVLDLLMALPLQRIKTRSAEAIADQAGVRLLNLVNHPDDKRYHESRRVITAAERARLQIAVNARVRP